MSIKYNDSFLASGSILGISVGHQSVEGNLHNKLLLNFNNNKLEIHLAFHHAFTCSEIIDTQSYIWDIPKIHPLRLKSVAARCLSIIDFQKDNSNLLPYAFGYQAMRRFNKEGMYSDYENGYEYGMSCATFILTVFNSVGIDLLDWKNWSDRVEDRDVFKKLLMLLLSGVRSGTVSRAHYENVRSESNVPKIRPEEVFSSVYCNEIPLKFSCADYLGKITRDICVNLPLQR